jgi:hypothetical protein
MMVRVMRIVMSAQSMHHSLLKYSTGMAADADAERLAVVVTWLRGTIGSAATP